MALSGQALLVKTANAEGQEDADQQQVVDQVAGTEEAFKESIEVCFQ